MNILLTNDDGYNSEGILLLKKKLSSFARVVIVAPRKQMSAKSVSITIGKGIKVEEVEKDVFAIDGTPADCVSLAINALNIKFDLVISGCNNGFNISYDTIYSGTIGAALEALTYRVPSIAISAEGNLSLVDKYFYDLWRYLDDKKLISNEYLLNINFPLGEVVEGIKASTLYYRKDDYYFEKEEDGLHAYRHLQVDFSDDKDSDCYLVNHGYISITPFNKTYFSASLLKRIQEKIK